MGVSSFEVFVGFSSFDVSRRKKAESRNDQRKKMEFDKRKAAVLASLGSTETDKSPKGTLDEPIIPLLNVINKNPAYFTTSSCSGRISILSQPKPLPTVLASNTKKKARGGSWLFITHDLADPDSVVSLLFHTESTHDVDQPSELVFRFEPLIIAVESRDLSSAQSLVSMAIACGFRESGITSCGGKRVIIAIRCSIRLEVPLGDTRKVMVSPEYVRFLVGIANEKMEANRKRTDGFFQALRSNMVVSPAVLLSEDQVVMNGGMRDKENHGRSGADQDGDGNMQRSNTNLNHGN